MKSLRDYINLIESRSTPLVEGWEYSLETPYAIEVPGTDKYGLYATLYRHKAEPSGGRVINLRDTDTVHYLLDVEIVDAQTEDSVDVDHGLGPKLIEAGFPGLVKYFGLVKKYDMYSPQISKIERHDHGFRVLATKFIDQT
jgi:hypothetical protein